MRTETVIALEEIRECVFGERASGTRTVEFERINSLQSLDEFCDRIRQESILCFDTEFVSEEHYRPELCLIQVQTRRHRAVIDPYQTDYAVPFWQLLSDGERTVVVHAGREELRFCSRFAGRPVRNLFDVQLAAGFVGHDYPASLGNLVGKILDVNLPKGETRTDWRRRPLSEPQLEYAVQDVVHLPALYDYLCKKVQQQGRGDWLNEELETLVQSVEDYDRGENWRRVSGSAGLAPKQLAIVRELWRWREATARELDMPPRRLLRDDLIVELARRGHPDIKRIRTVRGMERRNLQRHYDGISQAIEEGAQLAQKEWPKKIFGPRRAQSPLLTQFFSTAMAACCRANEIAPAIVGNSDDVRDLLAYELSGRTPPPPALARGWRGEIIGRLFHELLEGTTVMRVKDAKGQAPLEFTRLE